jgi:acyl carrier protein
VVPEALHPDELRHKLRIALNAVLPPYMHPQAIVLLDGMPLNENGKVKRSALPDPGLEDDAAVRRGVQARDEIEERLTKLWREVLGRQEPGVHDRFFDIGGHSLRATQLASRIRREFGVEIPLRALFENTTIAEQAMLLSDPDHAAPAAPAPTIARAERGRRVVVEGS